MLYLNKIFFPVGIFALLCCAPLFPIQAAENWSLGVAPQTTLAQYQNSERRNTLFSYGLFLNADYLDSGGLKFGYNFTNVDPKAGYPDIEETSVSVSGRYVYYTDSLGGKLGIRLDWYDIESRNKLSSVSTVSLSKKGRSQSRTIEVVVTDKTNVGFVQIDFSNFSDTFYADIGYADSAYDYANNNEPDTASLPDNTIKQLTLTLGFAFNNRYDWLQSRGYYIRAQHPTSAGGELTNNAIEFKWRHWFKPNAPFNVHSSLVKWVFGKRLFAVDPDSYSVYSIADRQIGSIAAGADWDVGDRINFLLLVGYDRYENLGDENKYSSRYVYGGLNVKW